jgi:hypothetical protein
MIYLSRLFSLSKTSKRDGIKAMPAMPGSGREKGRREGEDARDHGLALTPTRKTAQPPR